MSQVQCHTSGRPWFVPTDCAPGNCAAGVAADPQCCRCYVQPPPPPPPCGPCHDTADIVLLDPFNPPLDPAYQDNGFGTWDADGNLYLAVDDVNPAITYALTRTFAGVRLPKIEVDFVQCFGPIEDLNHTSGLGFRMLGDDAAAELWYLKRDPITDQEGLRLAITVFFSTTTYRFPRSYRPPFRVNMSIGQGQVSGYDLCVAVDGNEIHREEGATFSANLQQVDFYGNGSWGLPSGPIDPPVRAVDFDTLCVAQTPFLSSRALRWVKSVNGS